MSVIIILNWCFIKHHTILFLSKWVSTINTINFQWPSANQLCTAIFNFDVTLFLRKRVWHLSITTFQLIFVFMKLCWDRVELLRSFEILKHFQVLPFGCKQEKPNWISPRNIQSWAYYCNMYYIWDASVELSLD